MDSFSNWIYFPKSAKEIVESFIKNDGSKFFFDIKALYNKAIKAFPDAFNNLRLYDDCFLYEESCYRDYWPFDFECLLNFEKGRYVLNISEEHTLFGIAWITKMLSMVIKNRRIECYESMTRADETTIFKNGKEAFNDSVYTKYDFNDFE